MSSKDIEQIERKLHYTFRDKKLLKQAFTHSSYANIENIADNERMEFLGDAILSEIVSEFIYEHYPLFSEGELSKIRTNIVSAEALKPIMQNMDLVKYMLVAGGSDKIEEHSNKIFSSLFEAVLCAIYLDGGFRAAQTFALNALDENLRQSAALSKKDYKTTLQEYCQMNKKSIKYQLVGKNGPDNDPIFDVNLIIDEEVVATGSGRSKKTAEQEAAKNLLDKWRIN